MSATVGPVRIVAPQGELVIAQSVRGVHWVDMCRVWNWIAGRGQSDVPDHSPGITIAKSTTSDFYYRIKPRFSTVAYAYSFRLVAGSTTATEVPGSVDVTIPVGGTTYTLQSQLRQNSTVSTIIIERGAQASALAELSFRIDPGATTDCSFEAVSIVPLPRLVLSTSNDDLGIDTPQFLRGAPVRKASVRTQASLRVDNLRDAARRNGSFQYSRGITSPWAFTGAATDLFAGDFPLTGRYVYDADTARTLHAYVYAKCSDGTTAGTVTVDTTSGGANVTNVAIPAGSTSWAWFDAGTFTVDAEDPTDNKGLQASTYDDCQLQCARTAGAGSVQIASVSILDEAE